MKIYPTDQIQLIFIAKISNRYFIIFFANFNAFNKLLLRKKMNERKQKNSKTSKE